MRRMKLAGALVALTAGLLAGAQQASADIYIVRNANSSGLDSLRNRINDANNHPGHDTIGFRIPGNPAQTITPLFTPLPTITETVTIDGYTEPGSAAPALGSNADIRVAVNAANHNVGLDVAADDVTIRGLAIYGAAAGTGDAIRINGDDNRVEGNFLGLDDAGTVLGNDSDGVEIAGDGNVVGGSADADRNVIAGNGFGGVSMLGDDNRVRGNTIGTDPDATTDEGNDVGVWMFGAGNTVADNLISGNEVGVDVVSGTANEVLDNLIGTNAAGDHELVDGFFGGVTGVEVETAASDTEIAGNTVGGSASEGVLLAGDANTVRDNRLGTDGSATLNNMRGMKITGDANTVGGAAEGDGNLISGNRIQGIEFRADPVTDDPSEDNRVEGNLIGTDAEGDAPLPNDAEGVEIIDANDNDFVGNVISGNGDHGVRIRVDDTPDADGNRFFGNAIGTDADGALELGNGGDGVRIEEDADQNVVGGASLANPGNTVAHNLGAGVDVVDGTANTIVRNSMFANAGLGIDLGDDGVTLNDAGDVDTGSNAFINHPEVAGATTTTVDWEIVDGLANTQVRIDVYTCDGDEGRTHLGSVPGFTDGSGDGSGTVSLTTSPAVGELVTATATLAVVTHDETSEFSPCVAVS
jgi:parallel beta-helix repeat protein